MEESWGAKSVVALADETVSLLADAMDSYLGGLRAGSKVSSMAEMKAGSRAVDWADETALLKADN